MANSNFQTITKPKLYISYPLYQYANGALDSLATNYGVSDEDMIRMIQLDPSKITDLNPNAEQFNILRYRVVPQSDNFTDVIDSGLWNFDFVGILGHNLASAGAVPVIQASNDNGEVIDLATSNIVNHIPNSVPEYDGWSLFNLNDKPNTDSYNFNRIEIYRNDNGDYGGTDNSDKFFTIRDFRIVPAPGYSYNTSTDHVDEWGSGKSLGNST